MKQQRKIKKVLIVEGGGFKTGFTAGILDAFIGCDFDPFDVYMGVSGGAIAASYYLAKQYRHTLNSILAMSRDENFLVYRRTFGKEGYMNIDLLAEVAKDRVPFDVAKATKTVAGKEMYIVATNRVSGDACYLQPVADNWIEVITASCTLPFVTKGKHTLDGVDYFDGGWSDALPAKWAYDQGATHITILRTWPANSVSTQSWADYFGSIYFKSSPGLKNVFESSFEKYNNSVNFINQPPDDLILDQLCPQKLLRSGTYSYSKKTIMRDYRYGLDIGLQYVEKMKRKFNVNNQV